MNNITKMIKGCKAKLALALALLASASAFAEDAVGGDAVSTVNSKLDALNTSLGTTEGKVIAVAAVIAGIVIARTIIKKFFKI